MAVEPATRLKPPAWPSRLAPRRISLEDRMTSLNLEDRIRTLVPARKFERAGDRMQKEQLLHDRQRG
jgi:hypothetical protein